MLFITLSGQQCRNQSDMEALYQSWRNLHENDANGIKEYRNNSYDFPLARGRTGFEFKKDGAFIQYDIAPTDGVATVNGNWTLSEDKKTISIQLLNEAKTAYRLEIIELSQAVLKLKRIEP